MLFVGANDGRLSWINRGYRMRLCWNFCLIRLKSITHRPTTLSERGSTSSVTGRTDIHRLREAGGSGIRVNHVRKSSLIRLSGERLPNVAIASIEVRTFRELRNLIIKALISGSNG